MKVEWADSLEAVWGTPLTDRQIGIWEHYLKKLETTGAETKLAIEQAAKTDEVIKFRATVRDVTRWIEDYRKSEAFKRIKEGSSSKKAMFVSEWKEKKARGAKQDDFLSALDLFCADNHIGIIEYNEMAREILG